MSDSAMDLAVRRLEQAVNALEQRLAQKLKSGGAGQSADGLFHQDHAGLAAQLDEARARERELEAAGHEASQALGRAILEIRAALNGASPAEH